jgi:hypothetical protein
MTQILKQTALTACVVVIVLAAALNAAVWMHGMAHQTATPQPSHWTMRVPMPAEVVNGDPLVAAVLGEDGQPYTTVQADQVHLAADRVCEGFQAGVPLVDMEPELAREFSLPGVVAHQFVIDAHRIQCPQA